MSSSTAAEFGAGAVFGSALLLSGVYSPAVIVSQLQLSNFHMLEAFLMASAVSAGVVSAADRSGYSAVRIREPRQLRFGGVPFSANILGGGMLGAGMALTGACPGTVLVQIATGVGPSYYIGLGGLVGGVLFSMVKPSVIHQENAPQGNHGAKKDERNVVVRPSSPAQTVQNKLGLSTNTVLLTYEFLCLAMILASVSLAPKTMSYLPPALGGLFIGLAQAATLLMTRRTVGVSGAYQDIGNWLLGLVGGNPAKLLTPSVVFALGILGGSSALAMAPGITASDVLSAEGQPPLFAFVGGIASIFGASLAGGCTSGHGISGMATFSIASFVTVAAMFGGGIAVAMLFGH